MYRAVQQITWGSEKNDAEQEKAENKNKITV